MRIVSIMLAILVAWAAAPIGGASAEVWRDVIYREGVGIDPGDVRADVYAPEGAKDAPIILMMHGGAWAWGNKQDSIGRMQAPFFNAEGFIYVSVNFQLAPEHRFPSQVEDFAAAIAYFHEHAEEFGGDPDNIFLLGHSSGGHTAAMVSVDPQYLAEYDLGLDVIRGTVSLDSAAYNLALTGEDGELPSFYYNAFSKKKPDQWRAGSPTLLVEPDRAIPPMLLFYVDRAISPHRAKQFARVLREAGYEAKAIKAKGHTFDSINKELGADGDKVAPRIAEFYREHMKD